MPQLSSFERFRDEPDSPFYQAAGRTPEETWGEITAALVVTLGDVLEVRQYGRTRLTPRHIGEWHRSIFASTFPEDAGRFRSFLPNGSPEHVTFGISVGTELTERVQQMRGTHPRRIYERLALACNEFNGAVDEVLAGQVAVTLRTATFALARLYAKTLTIHPFVDGNLRAGFVALQMGLLNFDLPLVEFSELGAHDSALDTALRIDSRQSYERLSVLIAGILENATN